MSTFPTRMMLLAAVAAVGGVAQPRKAASAAVSSLYSQVPFDSSVARLPAHFSGHDIQRVYTAYESLRNAEKREFETTDQFNQRIQAEETKLFMGSKSTDVAFGFVVPVKSEYNADDGLLVIGVDCAPPNGIRRNVDRAIRVKSRASRRTYPATNGFGAKVVVIETDAESYLVAPINATEWPTRIADSHIVTSLKLTPDEARKVKGTISAVVVCLVRRGAPMTESDSILYEATFNSPRQYFEELHFVKGTVTQIWFFDTASGKVHAKLQPTSTDGSNER